MIGSKTKHRIHEGENVLIFGIIYHLWTVNSEGEGLGEILPLVMIFPSGQTPGKYHHFGQSLTEPPCSWSIINNNLPKAKLLLLNIHRNKVEGYSLIWRIFIQSP